MRLVVTVLAVMLVGCAGSESAPAEPTLVPAPLDFRFLPTNAARGELIGHDAVADLCVRVGHDFSPVLRDPAGSCSDLTYVTISRGSCDAGAPHRGNAEIVSSSGCLFFGNESRPRRIDSVLHVKSDVFNGAIRLKASP